MYGRGALVVAIVVSATAPTVVAQTADESTTAGARAELLSRCPDVPGARCGTIERPLDPLDHVVGGIAPVADRFPNSTFVQVANTGHVTALVDYSRCASNIVVEFVRTRSPGDTSCASQYQEVRTTDEFPLRLGDIDAPPGPGSGRQRRVASAVTSTVGDVFPRWFAMLGSEGVGLRGGTFTTTGLDVVRFRLDGLRWVENVAVSGRVVWDRATGDVTANVTCARVAECRLTIACNYNQAHAAATVTGRIDGERVAFTVPAP